MAKGHRLVDFCMEAPHTPLVGAKMKCHDVKELRGHPAYKRGGVLFTLVRFNIDFHRYTQMCLR